MDEQPLMIEGKCGNCQFWKKMELSGPREIGAKPIGQCYLLPPTPAPMYTRDMAGIRGQVNIRPVVKDDDGCGMFAARMDLLAAEKSDYRHDGGA